MSVCAQLQCFAEVREQNSATPPRFVMGRRIVDWASLTTIWVNFRVNLETGPEKVRVLLTGEHTIADVHCIKCHAYLGWKYLNAQDQENE